MPNQLTKVMLVAWMSPLVARASSLPASTSPRCEVHAVAGLRTLDEGRLSGLWAQEAIGADLAKDELASWRRNSETREPVPVAIVDAGLQGMPLAPLLCPDAVVTSAVRSNKADPTTHGLSVARLVADPVFGSAGHACFVLLGQVERGAADRGVTGPAVVGGYDEVFSSRARILNVSSRLNSAAIARRLGELAARGLFVVQAAGNDFPDFDSLERAMPDVIEVGSLGPDGLVSIFSAEFPEVAVLAPMDSGSLSAPNIVFSGTSGAAPLVSGALANVLDILPALGPDAGKVLLARTAVPTFAQTQGHSTKNGAGMLNAYRLVRAAECLAQNQRALDADSLRSEVKCFDFATEARAHLDRAESLVRKSSCEDRKSAWREFRASFLLNPLPSTARRLSAFENSLGRSANARFYRSFLETPAEVSAFLAETATEPAPDVTTFGYGASGLLAVHISGASTYAMASRLDPRSLAAKILRENLLRQSRSSNPEERLEALGRIAAGGPANADLLELFTNDRDEEVREKLAEIREQLPRVRAWGASLGGPRAR